jgi:hypothetical protein
MSESSPSALRPRETAPAREVATGLELPVDRDFDPRPPRLSPSDFVRWCEEMMTLAPANRDDPEQRFATKGQLEFSL